jgi:hypothetical protein
MPNFSSVAVDRKWRVLGHMLYSQVIQTNSGGPYVWFDFSGALRQRNRGAPRHGVWQLNSCYIIILTQDMPGTTGISLVYYHQLCACVRVRVRVCVRENHLYTLYIILYFTCMILHSILYGTTFFTIKIPYLELKWRKSSQSINSYLKNVVNLTTRFIFYFQNDLYGIH